MKGCAIMSIKQLSIFIENKPGRLADITETLATSKIDIRAISVADTSDFGILRIIVSEPEVAQEKLKNAGMTVSLSNVLAVCVTDKAGEFSKVARLMSDNSIGIEYVYDFAGKVDNEACIVVRVDDTERAFEILKANSIRTLSQDEFGE